MRFTLPFSLAFLFQYVVTTYSYTLPQTRSKFLKTVVGGVASCVVGVQNAQASPEVFTTTKGVKYAIISKSPQKSSLGLTSKPAEGDIVAIDYTGYLSGEISIMSNTTGVVVIG
jgi:hypothetical protein